jgi:fatty-acid desaturase
VTGNPWDGRPSGFGGLERGPLLVLLGWMVTATVAAWATGSLAMHDPERGLGAPGWALAVFLVAMTQVVFVGVGLVFHRALTHRACRLHPLVAYPLLALALPTGTPVQWVGNHRHHHGETDAATDWHSPRRHGFWAAHAGWYLYTRNAFLCALYTFAGPLRMIFDAFWRPQTNQEYVDLARDVAREPFYAWVSRPTPYAFFVLGQVAVSWCLVYLVWGTRGLVPLYLTQTAYFVIGDGVNSILHLWGARPFEARDESTNLPWMGWLAVGEGYHNAHHAFPRSIKCGLLPGQLDLVYLQARLFERLGLARDLVVPRPQDILHKLRDDRYRGHFEAKARAAEVTR